MWVCYTMGRFLLGSGFPRGSDAQSLRSLAIHVSIPIATHLHTRHVGPIVAAVEHSAVVLGRDRDFLVA